MTNRRHQKEKFFEGEVFFNLKLDRTEEDDGRKGKWGKKRGEKKETGRRRKRKIPREGKRGKNRVVDPRQSSAARLTTERL